MIILRKCINSSKIDFSAPQCLDDEYKYNFMMRNSASSKTVNFMAPGLGVWSKGETLNDYINI